MKTKKIFFVFFLLIYSLFFQKNFSCAKNAWDLNWLEIISREDWMADDKYLFSSYKQYKSIIKSNEELNEKIIRYPEKYKSLIIKKAKEKQRKKYLLENWKEEIRADKVIKKIKWKDLWWSLWFKYNKTKIIIHHTASNYNKQNNIDDVKKFLRWIYYYHSIRRGWWDIWYNFIIDKFWNIYEWRRWWNNVIWAHVKYNNVPSLWIALIWNFQYQKPTKEQINSLIILSTSLSQKYNIKPFKKTYYHRTTWDSPYIEDVENYSIVGHSDAGHTSCPGHYLYEMLTTIRKKVFDNLSSKKKVSYVKKDKKYNFWYKLALNWKISLKLDSAKFLSCSSQKKSWFNIECVWNKIYLNYENYQKLWTKIIDAKWKDYNYKIKIKPIWMEDLRYLMNKKAENYLWKYINKNEIKKIQYKNKKKNIEDLIWNLVSVLLYELSFYNYFDIYCENSCNIIMDKKNYNNVKSFKIDKVDPLMVWINWKSINTESIKITDSDNGLIYFKNYKRKSYAGIPWNNFRWEIEIKKDYFKKIWENIIYKYVVLNNLNLEDYLKWIAESNDQMPLEKTKVMWLLWKSYVLFYMNKKNVHPSIPENSTYNAIDDPRIFQKYVWAWYEKTSKNWSKVVKFLEDKYLFYNDYIPILPYFSCSPWFSYSAKQKFWRVDTPYLKNSIDLWKCEKFYGHWVWLSWKWAEYLAKKWFDYKKIINWYFPWVEVENLYY